MATNKEGTGQFSARLITSRFSQKGKRASVMIDNVDIIDLFFIEDIFQFSMVGKMVFIDRIGLTEFLPLTGHEQIGITFGDREREDVLFDIFSISNIEQFTQQEAGQSIIEIYFCDLTFKPLTQTRFSVSWGTEKISTIVKHIAENMVGIKTWENFEETKETISNFYMPYWTPMEALKWLMQRASGKETETAGYVFYNSRKGCNFVTLEKLLQSQEIEKDENTKQPLYYKLSALEDMGYDNIMLNWQMSSLDSIALLGISGARKLGYNFSTKQFIDRSYTYSSAVSKYTMLGKKTLYPAIDLINTKITPEGETSNIFLDNIYHSDFIKRYMNQLAIITLLRGNERRKVGTMADIQWPSSERKTEILNKSLEGKYLIKSLSHQFSSKTTPTYREKAVLLKNAYTENDYPNLVPATKRNLELKGVRLGKR